MPNSRRRRDQMWNPPSGGGDITALFVVVAAGPLLLPLIGAELDVLAFLAPLIVSAFAAWRCALAAGRGGSLQAVWLTFLVAALAAAGASVTALAVPESPVPYYVGLGASLALLAGAALLAYGAVGAARVAAVVDALLFPVVAIAAVGWLVLRPGIEEGDALLTAVVAVDLLALCCAAVALVAHPTRRNLLTAGPTSIALVAVTVGDALIAADAAGSLTTNAVPTALLWACGAYVISAAADFYQGASSDGEGAEVELSARAWLVIRVLLPLAAILVFPVGAAVTWMLDELSAELGVWLAAFCLLELALAFGRQAYLLTENRYAVDRERELHLQALRRSEELEALTGLATTMTQSLEEGPIIERGLGTLHIASRATSSAFFKVEAAKSSLALAAVVGRWNDERVWAPRLHIPPAAELHARAGRHVLQLPVRARGNDIGSVVLVRSQDDPLDDHQRELLELLVDQFAIAVQNARDYREKLEQAIRDPLTGVYNRRFFYEALEKELQRHARYGSTAALVLFDVDDFKAVNDSCGHQAGDDVLRRIAAIVGDLIRPVDSFARLGGEEFGLLLPETSQLDALLTAERLRTAIAREKILPDRKVTLSGGIAACPQDATSLEELEQKADAALYWVKRNGKNLCAVTNEVAVREGEDGGDRRLAHLHALVTMIDAEHLQTRDHSENVATYAVALGRAVGLDADHIVRLRFAAFFHDLGKVAVEREVLNKPDRLTEAEMAAIRAHPAAGAAMLRHAGLREEAQWVGCHHESLDGTGYPSGLDGDDIPFESRIILVADAFEAMTSDRPYRRGVPVDVAIAELRRCAGAQFDPGVVDALAQLVERDELAVLALKDARAAGPERAKPAA